ncbi:MAG: aspartyl-tRNA(Asn)/glutamyl-tRNA (Gln) amidotransferase subunit C [uncultured bacterium]|nr:MAG: aspartyl-tRNA(Asn)/glutamyl-tRNA (Gln) amidotransferase subunit C [uncultured bacterium]
MLKKEEIAHIAKLARIELTDAEVKKFQGQLGKVLNYVEKINEVDTENVEPTWQVTGLKDIMRDDWVEEFADTDELIESAPEREDRDVKVKSVF